MTDSRYLIVVTGELAEGAYLPEVKARLAALFGTPVDKLDPLFSGKRVVIKKGLDEEAAQKYRAAVQGAGLLCSAEAMPSAPPASLMSLAPPGVTLADPPKVAVPHLDTSAFSIAPRGATLDETPRPAAPDIDISSLAAAPAGEDLVRSERPPEPAIDTSALSVSPPGTRLVDAQPATPLEFDLGDLHLAPVGSDLGEMDRPKGPPSPDISHLTLDD